MGNLIYCRETKVTVPYYARELGISLYSAEELCYYIMNYVLLLNSDFIDEDLYHFIGDQLKRPMLEGKLRKWMAQTPDLYQGLIVILQDLHYYSDAEINQFRQKLEELRKAGPLELQKRKGDFFLEVRQYGNALSTYDQLLAQRQIARDKSFQAKVWHNRGIACVQLMQYGEAMDCFAKAWEVLRLEPIAKEMFVLYCMDDSLTMPEAVIASVPGETQFRWKEELDAFEKNAAYEGKAEDIAIAFNKDVIRRREAIRSLLACWKQEYREMAG